jgi:putative transposase
VAQSKFNPVRQEFNRLIPRKWLQSLAIEMGVSHRRRKIDVVPLLWSLILGFGVGKERTLAALRRGYCKGTGKTLAPSAFYDRFTPALAKLMKTVLCQVIGRVAHSKGPMKGSFAAFQDVLVTDSTVIRLHDFLKTKWPACRTNHTLAALKAHVILSVASRGPSSIKITSQRVHDGPVLRAGGWVKGRLLLFDLGYYRFQLFARIQKCGGFFVSRLKDGANPLITGVFQTWRGRSIDIEGRPLREVLGRLKRETLDVEVELDFRRRTYLGKRKGDVLRCRLVGIKNEETGCYHLYLTNVPVETLKAEEVARVYGARWIIELAFRELKSQYELEAMPSSKSYVVETLLYAAFLTMLASRSLMEAIRKRCKADADRCPDERWAVLFRSVADELLGIMNYSADVGERISHRIMPMLMKEMLDPNRGRQLLMQRARMRMAA